MGIIDIFTHRKKPQQITSLINLLERVKSAMESILIEISALNYDEKLTNEDHKRIVEQIALLNQTLISCSKNTTIMTNNLKIEEKKKWETYVIIPLNKTIIPNNTYNSKVLSMRISSLKEIIEFLKINGENIDFTLNKAA